jgi:hypothetical protein
MQLVLNVAAHRLSKAAVAQYFIEKKGGIVPRLAPDDDVYDQVVKDWIRSASIV